jgi:hypothetical protein
VTSPVRRCPTPPPPAVEAFRDDALDPGVAVVDQPASGDGWIGGRGGEHQPRWQATAEQRLECVAAVLVGLLAQSGTGDSGRGGRSWRARTGTARRVRGRASPRRARRRHRCTGVLGSGIWNVRPRWRCRSPQDIRVPGPPSAAAQQKGARRTEPVHAGRLHLGAPLRNS